MDRSRINELSINYVEKLSLYEEYSSRIRNLVEDLVERDDIEVCGIDGWAKAPAELVKNLDAHYSSENFGMLGSISDLVTVRVLLRFPEDVRKVEEIICSEFNVDFGQSVTSGGLEDPFRFGYPAVLYSLTLSESRASLREWQKYKDLPFRLELRTVLQEAWATIYPRVNMSVDSVSEKKFKRKLLRLAALLEEADEGFLSLWEQMKDASVLVPPQSAPVETARDASVDAERTYSEDELYAFFNESDNTLNKWNSSAIKAGFPIFVPSPNYLRESFQYMYKIFRAAGVDTISEVQHFLEELEQEDRGTTQLKTIRSTFEKESGVWRVDAFSAIFLLVLNAKWDVLKDKDLLELGVKKGSDRISGVDN